MKTIIKDGRIIILALFAVYAGIFTLVQEHTSFREASSHVFNVPAMEPIFADLRVIRGGYESLQHELDPYYTNPYDPWQRKFNYPPVWLYMLGSNISTDTIPLVGTILIIAFILTCLYFIGRVSPGEGVIYSFALVSPVVFLLLERGNIDIIIFILSVFSINLYMIKDEKASILSGFFISFLSILKFYPVFCALNLYENKKKSTIYFFTILGIVSLYLISIINELPLISDNTPREVIRSYGAAILPHILLSLMQKIDVGFAYERSLPILIGLSLFLLYMALISILALRNKNISKFSESKQLFSFRIGVLIFVGTFAIGNNWDYRLAFLILTIPQLLIWYKSDSFNRTWIASVILAIIILLNWMMISYEHTHRNIIFNELLVWYLVGCYIYFYVCALPSWITVKLKWAMPLHSNEES